MEENRENPANRYSPAALAKLMSKSAQMWSPVQASEDVGDQEKLTQAALPGLDRLNDKATAASNRGFSRVRQVDRELSAAMGKEWNRQQRSRR